MIGAGYDISMAFSGEEALAKALAEQPDLVLLDVMMPGMNGFEVCEKLKQAELTRFIPIVLLTALDQIEDKIRGLDAGADDFLTKPFNKVELMARVRSLLRIRALSLQIEQKNLLLFRLLNRYVSEEIVTEILTDPEQRLKLGGEKKDVVGSVRRYSRLHGFFRRRDRRKGGRGFERMFPPYHRSNFQTSRHF